MNFQQNNLKSATSPYLKQHENNPVWWQSWSDEVLNHAKKVNKPLLISIGYSACHWCHVMEHQSFEDDEVAKVMNKNFVCIKIDREERPDLDALYMNVSQLIHQSGGWPLNVFALPDGRPFYGGTYFPKIQWIELLENINHLYHHNQTKTIEYVNSIADGLNKMETIELKSSSTFSKDKIDETFEFWQQQFDDEWGGFNRAPKFMLPNAWETILRYGVQTKNENCGLSENDRKAKLPKGVIIEVTLGINIDSWHKEEISEICKKNNIVLYQAEKEAFEFKIKRERIV